MYLQIVDLNGSIFWPRRRRVSVLDERRGFTGNLTILIDSFDGDDFVLELTKAKYPPGKASV